jgi:hypothetical protein
MRGHPTIARERFFGSECRITRQTICHFGMVRVRITARQKVDDSKNMRYPVCRLTVRDLHTLFFFFFFFFFFFGFAGSPAPAWNRPTGSRSLG